MPGVLGGWVRPKHVCRQKRGWAGVQRRAALPRAHREVLLGCGDSGLLAQSPNPAGAAAAARHAVLCRSAPMVISGSALPESILEALGMGPGGDFQIKIIRSGGRARFVIFFRLFSF